MDKLNGTGEITFGAGCYRSFEGQKDFDKYYIDRVVKQVVKKTGEGEDDFILVDKVIETKRDIAKEIHAQSGDAGIDAYIRQYELIGEPIPDVVVGEDVQDFTEMPETLADAVLLGERSRKLFASLPKDLVGKMSYDEFISNFTQEKFDAYISSLMPPKEEEKKGE